MAGTGDQLEQGRESYSSSAWADAYDSLSRADREDPLAGEDLELLATSAYMLGREDDWMQILERAFQRYSEAGVVLRAARCAFWIGMNLALRGEMGPATGWLGRAQRLVEREERECVEQGYMLLPVSFQHEAQGDYDGAAATAAAAAEIGERFGDADLFALAEEWLGAGAATEDEGLEHLARRYFGAFGPATPDEVADWAGVPRAFVQPALERMRLRRFRDERGRELLDLPRAPLPDPDTPAPVRFLPTWDAVLLVHARRTGVLPERYRPRIFTTKTPQSVGTFLVDGAVAGTWRYDGGRVVTQAFGRLSRTARHELNEEAERLAAFHADDS